MNPSVFGMPIRVDGIVKKRKDGTYYVKITSDNVGGAKTTSLTQRWRLVDESDSLQEERIWIKNILIGSKMT